MSRIRSQGPLPAGEGDHLLVEVGNRITRARERRGLSRPAAAARFGSDSCYIGRVERGEVSASALYLIRLARALECEVGEFFPPIVRKPRRR